MIRHDLSLYIIKNVGIDLTIEKEIMKILFYIPFLHFDWIQAQSWIYCKDNIFKNKLL